MRVIAGSARRITLETPEGLSTRPTTDRIKETLFNIINNDLADCRFLDLFSGSGGIGIEALSRGAKQAVFVEQDAKALACIQKNLQKTRLAESAKVLSMEVLGALQYLKADGTPFDFIFMDPPYGMGYVEKVLASLKDSTICDDNTLIIAEEKLETDFSFVSGLGFEIIREKTYKTNKHIFMQRIEK